MRREIVFTLTPRSVQLRLRRNEGEEEIIAEEEVEVILRCNTFSSSGIIDMTDYLYVVDNTITRRVTLPAP